MASTGQDNPDRTRLRDHFASDVTDQSRWDDLWNQSYTPWDRAMPNPALTDLLQSRHPALNPPVLAPPSGEKQLPSSVQKARRPRALVPGCGRGYDVLLLASWGFDAFGVEISPKAVDAARAEVEKLKRDIDDDQKDKTTKDLYDLKDEKTGRGESTILTGDFFKDEWWHESCKGLPEKGYSDMEKFDLIYDYTFFCALPPALRPRWAARMAELLAPKGRLVCLEFPTYKDPSTEGPPWAVRPKEYVAYLSKPGNTVQYGSDGLVTGVDEDQPERTLAGLVRAAHFQPERTHEIGKGTDWISIWRHQ